MSKKCVHKGCGKKFDDDNEECNYHPGPPVFHEGQKGWKCCKPRVLTFDEFLSIPPCTIGKHSVVDDTPSAPSTNNSDPAAPSLKPIAANGTHPAEAALPPAPPRIATPAAAAAPPTPPAAPESDSDEPSDPVPPNTTCKRRACGVSSNEVASDRGNETCVYHPGQALFHEGSKGWTCCKKRVLEFDEFMKIAGCKTRSRHCFVGKKKRKKKEGTDSAGASAAENGGNDDYELLETVRHDFYQTSTTVHASLFLKKIVRDNSRISFPPSGDTIDLDLRTSDQKRYAAKVPLYGTIDPDKSKWKVLGTKLELELAKTDGLGWPVLRSDERSTGEIIQTGRAGRV